MWVDRGSMDGPGGGRTRHNSQYYIHYSIHSRKLYSIIVKYKSHRIATSRLGAPASTMSPASYIQMEWYTWMALRNKQPTDLRVQKIEVHRHLSSRHLCRQWMRNKCRLECVPFLVGTKLNLCLKVRSETKLLFWHIFCFRSTALFLFVSPTSRQGNISVPSNT
jgi:hypothetical protein